MVDSGSYFVQNNHNFINPLLQVGSESGGPKINRSGPSSMLLSFLWLIFQQSCLPAVTNDLVLVNVQLFRSISGTLIDIRHQHRYTSISMGIRVYFIHYFQLCGFPLNSLNILWKMQLVQNMKNHPFKKYLYWILLPRSIANMTTRPWKVIFSDFAKS